jgi:hypothetical protein
MITMTENKEIIIEGLLATTQVDSVGTKLTLESLESMLKFVKENPFITIEHDPTKEYEIEIIEAKIIKLKDGEFAIWSKFKSSDPKYIEIMKDGMKDGELKGFSYTARYPFKIADSRQIFFVGLDDKIYKEDDLKEIMSGFKESEMQYTSFGFVAQRSLDLTPVINLIIPLFKIFAISFTTAFGAKLADKLGDEIGDDLVDVYKKIKDKILRNEKTSEMIKSKKKLSITIECLTLPKVILVSQISGEDELDLMFKAVIEKNSIKKTDISQKLSDIKEIKLKWNDKQFELLKIRT